MNKKTLTAYAELLVKKGVNLQKGEMLVISAPVNSSDLVVEAVKAAYKAGARNVEVKWSDERITKLGLKYRSKKQLAIVPRWMVDQSEYYIENKVAYLVIISDDPEAFKSINPEKTAILRRATGKALKNFRDHTGSNKKRWSLAAYPNKKWAKKMFPDLSSDKAVRKLWEYVGKTVRLDREDPVAAWEEHQRNIERRVKILNGANIKYFRYKSKNGTDFTVGMPKGYLFAGGAEEGAWDKIPFTANMPTEEVFSCPDRNTAEGTLVSSMPLCRNGQIIKNFRLTFSKGRIVGFDAEEGYENLKSIIETDEGSHYLGEIALVGYNSPIRAIGTLFYETLFDENASCH
ncbi:MAG TPA: aminopeptidase, partial [Clostridiales bacterium]|nr:aminopeptidase [Clostridiales bacterium]